MVESGEKALLLRIYIGESDRFDHHPLYEAIVLKAREQGLAGATVLRGPMGYGHSSRLHTAKVLRLSEDLPMIVEIIDREEKITAFLPLLDDMVEGGLISLEEVRVLHYGSNQKENRIRSGTPAADGSP
jgi:PII-like signaling protein